jgi:hypothetical protein
MILKCMSYNNTVLLENISMDNVLNLCAFHTAAKFFAKKKFSKFYLSKKFFFEGVET